VLIKFFSHFTAKCVIFNRSHSTSKSSDGPVTTGKFLPYRSQSISGTDYRQVFSGAPLRACTKDRLYTIGRPCSLLLSYAQSTRVQVTQNKMASPETLQNVPRDRRHKRANLSPGIYQEVTKRQGTHMMTNTNKLSPSAPLHE